MKLFDVYPLNDINIVKAQGSYVWDANGTKYLDMYGGHAVISIGHTNPHWVKRIEEQLNKIAFYSNSIQIPIQKELADKLFAELNKAYEQNDLKKVSEILENLKKGNFFVSKYLQMIVELIRFWNRYFLNHFLSW